MDTKLLVLITVLKRSHRNSVILKDAAYRLGPKYGLAPQTFKKYIQEAIKCKLIVEKGDRYEIVKYRSAVSLFCKKNKLAIGWHDLLQSSNIDFKQVKAELERFLLVDNIVVRQEKAIEQKKRDIELISAAIGETGKKDSFLDKSSYRRLRKLAKEGKVCARHLERLNKTLSEDIRTSARSVADVLGVSVAKANKILNSGSDVFLRQIDVRWIEGANFFNLEKAKVQFPKALVHALPSKDKVKINLGSRITPPIHLPCTHRFAPASRRAPVHARACVRACDSSLLTLSNSSDKNLS